MLTVLLDNPYDPKTTQIQNAMDLPVKMTRIAMYFACYNKSPQTGKETVWDRVKFRLKEYF